MTSRTLFLIALAGALFGAERSTVLIDGSSTVYPITVAVAERYVAENPQANVEVLVSGSSVGFRRLLAGEIPIADASRPINAKEKEQAAKSGIEFIELAIAYDGLTVVVNQTNTFVDSLTVEELKRMWQNDSQVRTWKQVRPSWPDQPIVFVSAGRDNGTFDYFTEAINGKTRNQRSDAAYVESMGDRIQSVLTSPFSISYMGYAYYRDSASMLRAVPINAGNGAVLPAPQSILDGTYQPLSRPLFIYVNKAALNRQEVTDFVTFYLRAAQSVVPEVGYVPFNDTVSGQVRSRFAARTTGSLFASDAELTRFTTLLAQATPGAAAPAASAAPAAAAKPAASDTTATGVTAFAAPVAAAATVSAAAPATTRTASVSAPAPAATVATTSPAAAVTSTSAPAAAAAPAVVAPVVAVAVSTTPPATQKTAVVESAPVAPLPAPIRPVLADDTFGPAVAQTGAGSLAMARLALDPAASLEDLDRGARSLRGQLDHLLASLPDRRLIEAGLVSGVDAWRLAVRQLVRLHAAEAEPAALANAARAVIENAQRDQLAVVEAARTPAELAAAKTRENALLAFTAAVEQWSTAIVQAGAHP